MTARKENDEIDLLALVKVLWSKVILLVLAALIAGAAAFAGTFAVQRYRTEHAKYEAAVSLYVANFNTNYKHITSDSANYSVSSVSPLGGTASDSLMETYLFILRSRTTLDDVIAAADLPYSYEELLGMISAEAVDETAAFTVTVKSGSPAEAELIANTVAEILPGKIAELMEGSTVRIVDYAVTPAHRSVPALSFTKNTLIGALLGLFVAAAAVTVKFILSDVIMSADDLKAMFPDIPVLALIPNMRLSEKKEYYFASHYCGDAGKCSADGKKFAAASKPQTSCGQICEDMSFAASEAFKRLMTNVMMSFDNSDAGCRVIGVTSAQPGEGKSTVALSLACSLSQLGKRVLLIDADMRRPSLGTRLGLKPSPGLSGILGDMGKIAPAIQKYKSSTGDAAFDVITGGDIPHNTLQLLNSAQMERLSAALRPEYDYLIIDTPSMGAVIDAVPASEQADGMVVVVRENTCHAGILRDCVDQLRFAHANLLGFAVNDTLEGAAKEYRCSACT